jgi:hypothetical protein
METTLCHVLLQQFFHMCVLSDRLRLEMMKRNDSESYANSIHLAGTIWHDNGLRGCYLLYPSGWTLHVSIFLCYYGLTDSVCLMFNYMVLQEEAKEESDDDMGFSLFD